MKKSLYFLFILALFCLTGCKDALVPKPIKLTCNINTFDAPISCISRSTADADKLYIGQEDGCIIEKVNNNCRPIPLIATGVYMIYWNIVKILCLWEQEMPV